MFTEPYGHNDYHLPVEDRSRIVEILPLFQIKSFISGTNLISMPFLGDGGILADDYETEKKILLGSINLGRGRKSRSYYENYWADFWKKSWFVSKFVLKCLWI